jgi:ADP-heptose:LPS heptosyltransferase/SAM-dependent methyltransferase
VGTIPSYVQHIGGKSSLYGHSADPDIAPDFLGEGINGATGASDHALSLASISLPVQSVSDQTGRRPGVWKVIHQREGVITSETEHAQSDMSDVARELSRSKDGRHPILVVSTYGLGDALMMGPALDALHEKFPRCPIQIMCGNQEYIMFLYHPSIATIIAGPWNPKMERHVSRFYHHAYMMGAWLTQNPDAFWKNGYEIACEQLLVKPDKLLPRFHYTAEEDEYVENALTRHGIDRNRMTTVLIHGESSSLVRRWPMPRILDTAGRLAGGNTVVIVAATQLYSDFHHPPDIPNVMYTAREFADLSTRETLLLTKHVDLVIAVDSVFSHLSAAFGKPAVLLYGAFDPAIRAKHFPFATIVKSDVPCGPCHQHTPRCYLDELRDVPRCMDAITVNEVCKTATAVLKGRREPDRLQAVQLDETDMPPCPLCGSPVSHFAWRKRDVFYQKCDSCRTLFRPDHHSTADLFVPWREHWIDISKGGGRMQLRGVLSHFVTLLGDLLPDPARRKALDIGAGNGIWCIMLHEAGWSCDAYEQDGASAGELENLGIRNIAQGVSEEMEFAGDGQYDAVFLMHHIMFVSDLDRLMRFIDAVIAPDGLLVFTSPVANYASYNEAWPLNREVAGANLIIPSIQGLDIFMHRRGFEPFWRSKIRQRVSEIMVWRKV